MKFKVRIIYLLGFASFSCTQSTLNLADSQAKRIYLEEIFSTDQHYRKLSGEITSKYGYYSDELKENDKMINTTDSLNLIKIENYLKTYGHPNQKEVGEIAAITPWAVIHHSGSYEVGERNFPHLHGAFINEDIDDGQFSMYLNRMYQIKYGKRYEVEGKFNEGERLEQLINILGLNKDN